MEPKWGVPSQISNEILMGEEELRKNEMKTRFKVARERRTAGGFNALPALPFFLSCSWKVRRWRFIRVFNCIGYFSSFHSLSHG